MKYTYEYNNVIAITVGVLFILWVTDNLYLIAIFSDVH